MIVAPEEASIQSVFPQTPEMVESSRVDADIEAGYSGSRATPLGSASRTDNKS